MTLPGMRLKLADKSNGPSPGLPGGAKRWDGLSWEGLLRIYAEDDKGLTEGLHTAGGATPRPYSHEQPYDGRSSRRSLLRSK